jgi:hypothetical protein
LSRKPALSNVEGDLRLPFVVLKGHGLKACPEPVEGCRPIPPFFKNQSPRRVAPPMNPPTRQLAITAKRWLTCWFCLQTASSNDLVHRQRRSLRRPSRKPALTLSKGAAPTHHSLEINQRGEAAPGIRLYSRNRLAADPPLGAASSHEKPSRWRLHGTDLPPVSQPAIRRQPRRLQSHGVQ